MTYNITAISNITGIGDFITQMDNHIFCISSGCGGTGGLLGTAMLIIIFGVLMINFISNGRDFNSSLMAASLICTILGGFMFVMGILAPIALYVTIGVWALSVALGSKR